MIVALLIGLAIGFLSAVPVAGPVSALILSYGMRGKYPQGRFVAFGAGLGEGAYTFLAFWGFSYFVKFQTWILVSQSIAAGVLAALGVYFYRSKKMRHPQHHKHHQRRKTKRSFLLGLGMSAANPSLIATWTAVITTLYHFKLFEFTTLNTGFFAIGVWIGIYAWFSLSLRWMAQHRHRIKSAHLDWMLKGVGVLLIGLAVWMVYRVTQIG